MKKLTLMLTLVFLFFGASVCFAVTYVGGYFRKDGTGIE